MNNANDGNKGTSVWGWVTLVVVLAVLYFGCKFLSSPGEKVWLTDVTSGGEANLS